MKRFLILALLIFAVPAHADKAADMTLVIDTHMAMEEVPKRLDSLYTETADRLEPAIKELGGTIIDKDAFQDALLGDFDDETLASMRSQIASLYELILTPAEITTLADFYRSSEGAAWVDTLIEGKALTKDTTEFVAGPLAPLQDHWPVMQSRVSEMRSQNEKKLGALLDLRRIAEIMAMDHIVSFETEERRQMVLDGLEVYLTN